jgi:hypothetical protein
LFLSYFVVNVSVADDFDGLPVDVSAWTKTLYFVRGARRVSVTIGLSVLFAIFPFRNQR